MVHHSSRKTELAFSSVSSNILRASMQKETLSSSIPSIELPCTLHKEYGDAQTPWVCRLAVWLILSDCTTVTAEYSAVALGLHKCIMYYMKFPYLIIYVS